MPDYSGRLARFDDSDRVERERLMAEKDPQGPVSTVPPAITESHAPTDEVTVETTTDAGSLWTGDWGTSW